MGHDVTPIGNHNLDTTDIWSLAADLATRLNVNVEMGYLGEASNDKLLGIDENDEYRVFDTLVKNEGFSTWKLIDTNYQEKQLYKKYGKDVFYTLEYWNDLYGKVPAEKEILNELRSVDFAFYKLVFETAEEAYEFDIFNDHFSSHGRYYFRWGGLSHILKAALFLDEVQGRVLFRFRKDMMKYSELFGGSKFYYLDDQAIDFGGVGQGEELYMSWGDLEAFIKEKSGSEMFDVAQCMLEKDGPLDYLNEFFNYTDYISSFVDNFRDLRQS